MLNYFACLCFSQFNSEITSHTHTHTPLFTYLMTFVRRYIYIFFTKSPFSDMIHLATHVQMDYHIDFVLFFSFYLKQNILWQKKEKPIRTTTTQKIVCVRWPVVSMIEEYCI